MQIKIKNLDVAHVLLPTSRFLICILILIEQHILIE